MTKSTSEAAAARIERQRLAKLEHAALMAWEKNDRKGDRPSTENLDALETNMGKSSSARTRGAAAKSTQTREPMSVRLFHDGKPMPDSQNKMSSIAWYYTKGVGSGGSRLDVTGLRSLLAKQGVADPEHTSWDIELSNGITLSGRIKGDKAPAVKAASSSRKAVSSTAKRTTKAAPKKTAAKKTTSTKSTAKRTTTSRKSTARKAS